MACEKPLVFLLDSPKIPEEEKGRKRKKGKKEPSKWNIKNFGSVVNISMIKKAERVVIGWRARLGPICH